MKKTPVTLVLAAIGYLAWALLAAESDAALCYREFAGAWEQGRLDEALSLTAEGSEARRMVESRIDRKRRGLPAGIADSPSGVAFDVVSERAIDGGRTVILRARQPTLVAGAGEEPAPERSPLAEHEVTLTIEGARWKVASFEETMR